MTGTDATGLRAHLDAHATPLPWFDRAAAGLKATMDDSSRSPDSTDVDEALARLQALATLGQLTSEVAHEFGNLLTVMLGYSELLLADLPSDGSNTAYLEQLHRAAERASSLTTQVLGRSRSKGDESGTTDLGEVVRGLGSMLGHLFGSRVDLRVSTSDGCRVGATVNQVEQLVINLLLNARDALGPNGGRIDLSVDQTTLAASIPARIGQAGPGKYVRLRVRDFGGGMPEATQADLFAPFFTTKPTGTGLGLAVVARIARQANAAVVVQSRIGEGTTFEVFFPRAA